MGLPLRRHWNVVKQILRFTVPVSQNINTLKISGLIVSRTVIVNGNEGKIYIKRGFLLKRCLDPLMVLFIHQSNYQNMKEYKIRIYDQSIRWTHGQPYFMYECFEIICSSKVQLHTALRITFELNQDLKMNFGLNKCKSV